MVPLVEKEDIGSTFLWRMAPFSTNGTSHVAAGIMVNVLNIHTVKSEFRKGKYEKFCEGSNQFCKVRQFTSLFKICYFPLLQWLGEKIYPGCSLMENIRLGVL